jgi:DNA-binding CsgD family transcriptional regulator
VALAAGGVVLSSKLRKVYKHEVFSQLLYFQVFIFTFGFYGIWGQVVIRAFLSTYISEDLLVRFSDISMLMGLPFLVFAWLMLLQLSMSFSGRKKYRWFVFWFLFFNFAVILAVGYIISKTAVIKPASLIKYYFILMNFLYSLFASLLIYFPVKEGVMIHEYDRKIISPLIFLIAGLQCVLLHLYTSQPITAILFILAFFTGNTFLPVYLSYGTLLSEFTVEPVKILSLEEFCIKYDVSPRETDIVREICNGLSNKEISDKLFISLQTVKDHTHRIYTKTNLRSRVQLINLVKETKGH